MLLFFIERHGRLQENIPLNSSGTITKLVRIVLGVINHVKIVKWKLQINLIQKIVDVLN